MSNMKKLKLKQISEAVKEGKAVPIEKIGHRLRDVRKVLGMTQKQLAKRLKISQPLLSSIEDNTGSCSLKTIAKVAAALECDFLGVIASKRDLEVMIAEQARKRAKALLDRSLANMALEKQAPVKKGYKYYLESIIKELASDPRPELWEE
jgi:predicted DNA-binding mobile mystery protein A